jgi:ATP-binding cassette subfamily B protein
VSGAGQAKPASPFRRLVSYLRPHLGWFYFAFFLTVSLALLAPYRTHLVQVMIDGPVAEGNGTALHWYGSVIIGLIFTQAIVQYCQMILTNRIGQSILNRLRQDVFRHILRLRLRFYDTNPIGALQTRVISDIQTLASVYSDGLVSIAGDLLQLVAITAFMFHADWRLTLAVLAVVPLIIVAVYIFKLKVNKAFGKVRKYVAELNTFLQEHITGLQVTQVFHQQEREAGKFRVINQKHRDANIETILYYSIFFPVVELVAALALAVMVWYGTNLVLSQTVSLGTLVAFISYINMFFRPIRTLADQFNTLQMGLVSAERIFKVLDTDEVIPEAPAPRVPTAAVENEIVFDNVRFSYDGTTEVLRGISFTVPTGSTTAIVGATGSGKSTTINLLLRLYDATGGTISVQGVPTTEWALASLRSRMGLVMQDVFLFSGTIEENISLLNPAITRAQIERVIDQVGARTLIDQLPGGLDYRLGERGAGLSTGQRQIISFCRILVYDPPILLLDEATANIDSETEALLQQTVDQTLSGRTSIVVAHRLSTIQKADQILVMRKGEIVERGTHQQLLALNGYYRRLYELQYGLKPERV